MIITCNNCNKKFDLDPNLIPKGGRQLQCNSCNHKWFFIKEQINKVVNPIKIIKNTKETIQSNNISILTGIESSDQMELLDKENKETLKISKKKFINVDKDSDKSSELTFSKKKKNANLLGLVIVFTITFIALIILIDTFQVPVSKIIPNIEIILYNLYETINDIQLFLKDLF